MYKEISWVLIGAFIGIFFTAYCFILDNSLYFKVYVNQTRQNIISFPNGAVFKKITEANEVNNDERTNNRKIRRNN